MKLNKTALVLAILTVLLAAPCLFFPLYAFTLLFGTLIVLSIITFYAGFDYFLTRNNSSNGQPQVKSNSETQK